jgi:hypothetical protein
LPVVPNSGRAATVHASLKKSDLWNGMSKLHLKENMRVTILRCTDPQCSNHIKQWADLLLKIGGEHCTAPLFCVPDNMINSGSGGPLHVFSDVFVDISLMTHTLMGKCIFSAKMSMTSTRRQCFCWSKAVSSFSAPIANFH